MNAPAILVRLGPGRYRAYSRTTRARSYNVQVANVVWWAGVCDCKGGLTAPLAKPDPCYHARAAIEKEQIMANEKAVATRGQTAPKVHERIPDVMPVGEIGVQMTSSLIPSPADVQAMITLANVLAPERDMPPAQLLMMMVAGWELGVGPVTANNHMMFVRGKVEPDSQLMMALARAKDATASFIFHETNAQVCDIELKRSGKSVIRVKYTMEDATRSGQADATRRRADGSTYQIKGPWQLYPADMLRWAAIKRACRLGAPDLINNVRGVNMGVAEAMLPENEEAVAAIQMAERDGELKAAAATETIEQQTVEQPIRPSDEITTNIEQGDEAVLTPQQALRELLEATFKEIDRPNFLTHMAWLNGMYPSAREKTGRFNVDLLSDEEAINARRELHRRVYGEGPPSESDDVIDDEATPEGSEQQLPFN